MPPLAGSATQRRSIPVLLHRLKADGATVWHVPHTVTIQDSAWPRATHNSFLPQCPRIGHGVWPTGADRRAHSAQSWSGKSPLSDLVHAGRSRWMSSSAMTESDRNVKVRLSHPRKRPDPALSLGSSPRSMHAVLSWTYVVQHDHPHVSAPHCFVKSSVALCAGAERQRQGRVGQVGLAPRGPS